MTSYFYYRCSTDSQDETRQVEAALKVGVQKSNIFGDKITGVSQYGDRPEYSKMVALLQPNDLVITEDLTRYGRSMVLMLVEINNLLEKGVQIKTLDGRLDTTTMPEEIVRLIVGVMGYAAEMELKNIKKRTSEGRAVAMNKGVKFGRKRQYTQGQEAQVIDMRTQGNGYGSIANAMGLNVSKVRRILANNGVK